MPDYLDHQNYINHKQNPELNTALISNLCRYLSSAGTRQGKSKMDQTYATEDIRV